MKRVVFASIVLAVSAVSAQTGSGTAHGPATGNAWRNARWGMTVDELLAAFPGEATRLPEPQNQPWGVARARIEPYRIAKHDYAVRFDFDSGGRLVVVQIRSVPLIGGCDGLQYDDLASLMIGKYGPPFSSEKEGLNREMSWKTSQALIQLAYVDMVGGNGACLINYRPPVREGTDRL